LEVGTVAKAAGTRRPRASSRDAILAAFSTMVADRGYAEASLADVAAAVRVSKGTIVHHFGTKDRMLAELQERYMQSQLADLRRIEDEFDDPLGQLVGVVYALLATHENDTAAARGFMREFSHFASSVEMRDVRLMRREFQARVGGIIEHGMEVGAFRRADVQLVTLQVFGMCNHAWTWYRTDGRATVHQIATTFLTVLLGGLVDHESDDVPTPAELTVLIDRAAALIDGAARGTAPAPVADA
jgi:AcrR family transcriptional regulator